MKDQSLLFQHNYIFQRKCHHGLSCPIATKTSSTLRIRLNIMIKKNSRGYCLKNREQLSK